MRIERYTAQHKLARKPLIDSDVAMNGCTSSTINGETNERRNLTFYTLDGHRVTLTRAEIAWIMDRFAD